MDDLTTRRCDGSGRFVFVEEEQLVLRSCLSYKAQAETRAQMS
jgi:hypothetical protein